MNSTMGRAAIAIAIIAGALGLAALMIATKKEPEKTPVEIKDFLVDAQQVSHK